MAITNHLVVQDEIKEKFKQDSEDEMFHLQDPEDETSIYHMSDDERMKYGPLQDDTETDSDDSGEVSDDSRAGFLKFLNQQYSDVVKEEMFSSDDDSLNESHDDTNEELDMIQRQQEFEQFRSNRLTSMNQETREYVCQKLCALYWFCVQ